MHSTLGMNLVPPKPFVRPRALLVEDDPDIHHLTRRALLRQGFIVSSADDGAQGLALARTFVYDVILTDVMMPRISGPEMIAAVRANERAFGLPRVPIVAVTASIDASTRMTCMEAGVTVFMRKPLDVPSLLENLALVVDKRPCTLVVSDCSDAREDIVHALGGTRAINVIEAEGTRNALERVRTQRVDVIVLDADWALRDAFALADALRTSTVFGTTKIIAVTKRHHLAMQRRCLAHEGLDVLVKPIDELGDHLAAACA